MDLGIFKKTSVNKKWIQLHLGEEDRLLTLNSDCEKVSCVAGKLWVTSPTLGNDFVLRKGETLDVKDLESVVVEAIGEADIGVFTQWH